MKKYERPAMRMVKIKQAQLMSDSPPQPGPGGDGGDSPEFRGSPDDYES